MPVGTQSSANSLDAAKPVLRSGESLASTAKALSNPNAKTYYHMVPGACFTMPDGLTCRFFGGRLTTDDPVVIAELDKIVDKATSQIFSKTEARESVDALAKLSAEDAGKQQAPNLAK